MRIHPLNINSNVKYKTPAFGAYSVCLLDNGKHGEDVSNFARTVLPEDAILKQIEVETNSIEPDLKQVDGLLKAVREINNKPVAEQPEYLIIPVLVEAPLPNLTDQMRAVMGCDIRLTPQNIKENKELVINFLKLISENPDRYRMYINYLDPLGLKIEYMYPLLQEIKKASSNGIKVYVPAGHPEYQSIKYLTETNNLKPELYHFLSTGEDINGSIKKTSDYIKQNNWYDFNLLELADAEIVKLLDADGKQHLYSSYDNFETKAKRGIYNLYPIRKNGQIDGFSFTDKVTNQYPEIHYMERLSALTKFVGLQIDDVLADNIDLKKLKGKLEDPDRAYLNKLYRIEDVFSEEEIKNEKMNLKGKFVDSSLKLFFDVNDENEVIFKNCNYERSSRPSVKSMFGACFSTCNAIADDIKDTEDAAAKTEDNIYKNLIFRARTAGNKGNSLEALRLYESAQKYKKEQLLLRNIKKNDLSILLKDELNVAKTSMDVFNFSKAEEHYRRALNIAMQNNSTSDIIKANCSNGLGCSLLNLGKIKEANYYLNLASNIFKKKACPKIAKLTGEDIDIKNDGGFNISGFSNLSVS